METPKQSVPSITSQGIGAQHAGQEPAVSDAAHRAAAEERAHRVSERVQTLRLEKQPVDSARPRRRWWWLLLVLFGLGAVLAYRWDALRGLSSPVEVDSITASCEPPVEVVLDTTGNVVAPITVDIIPQVSGTVAELNLEVEQKVKKGELLLRIDAAPYLAELQQAKASLAAAQARLDGLTKELKRADDIHEARAALDQAKARLDGLAKELQRAEELKDVIPPAEYDQTQASYREAQANVLRLTHALHLVELGPRDEQIAALKAEVEKAEALVRKAQFFYDCTEIRSPIDGTVLERSVERGEIILIQPGVFAQSIATIADLSRLEVEIEIQERDLAAVRVGQACIIIPDAYPDRRYRGRLDRLAPVLNRQRGSRQANIVLANPDGWLAANMNCRVQVLKKEPPEKQREVVRVPTEAIVMEGGQAFLFVADEGTVHRRSVRLGTAEDGKVEVLDGLADGEEVLLPGDKNLEEGQVVRTRLRSNGSRG